MSAAVETTARPLRVRVSPVEGVRQTCSLAWRTLVQIKHNPFELMDFTIQPVMFVLLFTYVFGGAIAGSPHKYLTFALPGIIVQNALFTTLNTGVGLSTDLEKGFFDRLRALLIVGAILGFRIGTGPASVLAAFALLLVSTLAVSWAIVLVSMLAAKPEKVQVFGFIVLFPLTFTSDAFVRTASMPGWLQAWAKVNPVSLLSDAARGLLVSGPVTGPALASLLYALGFTVVFAPLAVRALRRRV